MIRIPLLVIALTLAAPGELYDEVLALLGEGIDSAVVLAFVERQDTAVGDVGELSADDLVKLSRAGASDALIAHLIELSTRPADTPRSEPEPAPRKGPAEVAVDFRLTYKPRRATDDPTVSEPDLYVYLDGDLLARVGSQAGLTSRAPVELVRQLEPGRHVVRLMREQHESRGRKSTSWDHDTYVAPDAIEFQLDPGHRWAVSVKWAEPRFAVKKQGPLSWTLERDGAAVDGAEKIGTGKDDWPELCDDVEATVPAEKLRSRRYQRILESCTRWSELWTDGAPSRRELLDLYESEG